MPSNCRAAPRVKSESSVNVGKNEIRYEHSDSGRRSSVTDARCLLNALRERAHEKAFSSILRRNGSHGVVRLRRILRWRSARLL